MQIDIFVISMRQSEARRRRLSEALSSIGLSFEFIDAVDGKTLPAEMLRRYRQRRGIIEGGDHAILPSEIGCALSHVECARLIGERRLDGAIILEDDAIPLPGLAGFANHFQASDPNYKKGSMIFLGGLEDDSPRGFDRHRMIVGSLHGRMHVTPDLVVSKSVDSERFFIRACAYYLDAVSAARLVGFNSQARTVADNWSLFTANGTIDNIYFPRPWAVRHPCEAESPSLLEPERKVCRRSDLGPLHESLSSLNRQVKNVVRPPFRRLLSLLK